MTSWLADQLPAYLLEDRRFSDFLAIFAALAGETRVHGDCLPYLVDVDVTPGPILRYLAHWLAFDELDPGLPDLRQRQLVSSLAGIVAWRGTRRGLIELLTLLTEDEVVVTSGAPAPIGGISALPVASRVAGDKVVTVRVANTAWLTAEQFTEFVRNEIPADCTLELIVDGRALTDPVQRPRSALQ